MRSSRSPRPSWATSSASTIRTATSRSTTRWCAWRSPSRSGRLSWTGTATSARSTATRRRPIATRKSACGVRTIIVTSIPYAEEKAALVAKIADVIIERRLASLVDVRDESTEDVRIVLEIKREADAALVMTYLYKHTPLETTVPVNLTCLVPTANPEVCEPARL